MTEAAILAAAFAEREVRLMGRPDGSAAEGGLGLRGPRSAAAAAVGRAAACAAPGS